MGYIKWNQGQTAYMSAKQINWESLVQPGIHLVISQSLGAR